MGTKVEIIQKLMKEKADLQAQINVSTFDGSIAIQKSEMIYYI